MPAPTAGKAQKVRFGAGIRSSVGDELVALGCSRALVLATPQQLDMAMELAAGLNGHVAGIFSGAMMHTPVAVTESALEHACEVGADCFVAIGGSSTTGLSKALALRTGDPQIVIPTTYAGSEATPILGQTKDGAKATLTDPAIRPDVVLYDPELVVSLPKSMTIASALNAMAHAVEALYASDRSDEMTSLAIHGLQSFKDALPRVIDAPEDVEAREKTLRGAHACGSVLGGVGMALHHKLCHTLGGSFDLPHAEIHAAILPHTVHYNSEAVPDLLEPIINIFGGNAPGQALWGFASEVGAVLALKDFGLMESDLDRATDLALTIPYWNPLEITADGIRGLLQNAWSGIAPGA